MADTPPVMVEYLGEGKFRTPSPHWRNIADRNFARGERYTLIQHQYRSRASHSHFFASLHDAHANLPPELAMMIPSAEHLRKYALIKSGWCNTQTFVMADHDQATKLRRELRTHDEFAVVLVNENVVTIYTAKSQSERNMGKQDFQKSKQDVLDVVAGMIHVSREELENNSK